MCIRCVSDVSDVSKLCQMISDVTWCVYMEADICVYVCTRMIDGDDGGGENFVSFFMLFVYTRVLLYLIYFFHKI